MGQPQLRAVSDDLGQWMEILSSMVTSRLLDRIEETELYPERKIAYHFSAAGHELAQVLLARELTGPRDAVTVYYRSRPLLLALGLSAEEAFAGPLGKSGGLSDGRDIGVVFNMPARSSATVLPMTGDVGGQFTPAAGWAEALVYLSRTLGDRDAGSSIAVALGGEGSVATNGFWSALVLATTLSLPILFFIEDNGYAISVPAEMQTPGGNIVTNLGRFQNLLLLDGDGTDPETTPDLVKRAVSFVREKRRPALLRLVVPRLAGHSGQDSQSYKGDERIRREREKDPLPRLRSHLGLSSKDAQKMEDAIDADLRAALERALSRPEPDPARITEHEVANVLRDLVPIAPPSEEGQRLNMQEAIRRTLATELHRDKRVLVFGEDVGAKGGVHAVTLGLQAELGEDRVFDTGLSEEGIIGRAVGMGLAGLRPIAEIQFRKYADAATEQLHNCGTIPWRTAGSFSAPVLVRLAGGFSRRAGDPWHSVTDEAEIAHAVGWQLVVPSNAADAVGLLRGALASGNPTVFFEHRALLDAPTARRPYPGDDYVLPVGRGVILQDGSALTLVAWGAMVERAIEAAASFAGDVAVIDLRSLAPWDKVLVLDTVRRTGRCLVVHEDRLCGGFGAEIIATVASEAFGHLDAPPERLGAPHVPVPYNLGLMNAVIPSVELIAATIERMLSF